MRYMISKDSYGKWSIFVAYKNLNFHSTMCRRGVHFTQSH